MICAPTAADTENAKARETTRACSILRCVQGVGKAFSGMLLERVYDEHARADQLPRWL